MQLISLHEGLDYLESEPKYDHPLMYGPHPAPAVQVGDVVTVTGLAYRTVFEPAPLYAHSPRHAGDAQLYQGVLGPTRCLFLGWSHLCAGTVHPATPYFSSPYGDSESEPAYFEETYRVKVAVVQPIDASRPAQYRKPFRCLPEHIVKERTR